MPKKWLRKLLPSADNIKRIPYIDYLGDFIHNPNFWHLNRYSVSTAVSVGIFISFMPFPGHMLMAALIAILLRANLPISVSLVWISNPFTIPPMIYASYKIGTLLLHVKPVKFHIEMSFHWLYHELVHVAAPLLMGSFTLGMLFALIGNLWVRLWWRYHVAKLWKKRQKLRITHMHPTVS